MKVRIKCYAYSPADDPFLMFDADSPEKMFKVLAEQISWRDFPNDVWVKIGSENCILYNPMLDLFSDWDGISWVNISKERVIYYFTR